MTNDRKITISVGSSRKAVDWQPQTLLLSEFWERLRIPARSTETVSYTHLDVYKRQMLNCDLLIDGTRLKKETGNAIIMKIMDSLKGLNVTSALEVLEECKKEVYDQAKL